MYIECMGGVGARCGPWSAECLCMGKPHGTDVPRGQAGLGDYHRRGSCRGGG